MPYTCRYMLEMFLNFYAQLKIYVKNWLFFYLAPSIYENEDIKKGILLQLFGGCRKDFSHSGRGKFRQV